MGSPAEPEPSLLTLHPLALLPCSRRIHEIFQKAEAGCCRGTQLALLALVTTALWAGLLTLLLLWREGHPLTPETIRVPPDLHSQTLGSPISLIPHLGDTYHPKPPSPAGKWGVDGWEHPKYTPFSPPLLSLIHPFSMLQDWESARNLKQLEETAAQNGGGRGAGSSGAETRLLSCFCH